MRTDATLYGGSAERAFSIVAWTMTLPWMLAGFGFFGVMGIVGLVELEKTALPMLAVTLAGLVGLTGLIGSYFTSSRTRSAHIEGESACLVVGIAAALFLAVFTVVANLPTIVIFDAADLYLLWISLGFAAIAAEGCLALRRLRRARFEAEGAADAVPSVDALLLAASVIIALTVLLLSGL